MIDQTEIFCPYCGEVNIIEVSISEGKSQNFIEDCEICCRPIEIKLELDKFGNINVEVKNEEGF